MVLEDDVYFAAKFEGTLTKHLHKLRNVEWDVLYLGLTRPDPVHGKLVKSGIYAPLYPLWGTHAYVIKRTTVERIIDAMLPIAMPFDVKLMDLPNLKRLALTRFIVHAYNHDSDTRP